MTKKQSMIFKTLNIIPQKHENNYIEMNTCKIYIQALMKFESIQENVLRKIIIVVID